MTLESIANWLGYFGVQNTITTALMAVVVWLLCRVYAKNPAVQNLLWLLVLLKFVLPPVPGLTWQLPALAQFDSQPVPVISQLEPVASMSSDLNQTDQMVIDSALLEVVSPQAEEPPAPNHWSSLVSMAKPWHIITSVWLIGATSVLACGVFQSVRRRRIVHLGAVASEPFAGFVTRVARQLGLRAPVTRLVSGIDSPFLCCLGRVTLAWPRKMAALSESKVRAVLAHEIAHLRRGDHWVARLELIASTVWWWNPVYWYVRRQLRCTAEMSCDAIALTMYPDDRSLYAEMLLWLSTSSKTGAPPLFLAVGGGAPSSLERRMTMIVSDRVSGKLSWSSLLVAGLLAAIALPAWSPAQDASRGATTSRVEASGAERAVAEDLTPLTPTFARLLEGRKLFVDKEGGVHVQIAPAPAVRLTAELLSLTFAFPTRSAEVIEISRFPHAGTLVVSAKTMSGLASLLEKSGFEKQVSKYDVPTSGEDPSVNGFIFNQDYERKDYRVDVTEQKNGGFTIHFVALVSIPGDRSQCLRVRRFSYSFEKQSNRMACYSDVDLLVGPALHWQEGDGAASSISPMERQELHKQMFELCRENLVERASKPIQPVEPRSVPLEALAQQTISQQAANDTGMPSLTPTHARLLEGRKLFVDKEGRVHVQVAPAPAVPLTNELLSLTFAFPSSQKEALEISQYPHTGAIVKSEKVLNDLVRFLEESGFDKRSYEDESLEGNPFLFRKDFKGKECVEEVKQREDGGFSVEFVALVRIPGDRSQSIRVRRYGYNFEKKPQTMVCYLDYELLCGPALSWQTVGEPSSITGKPTERMPRHNLHDKMFEKCGNRLHIRQAAEKTSTLKTKAITNVAQVSKDAWSDADEAMTNHLKEKDIKNRPVVLASALLRKYLPDFRVYVRYDESLSTGTRIFMVNRLGEITPLPEESWTGKEGQKFLRSPSVAEFFKQQKIKVQSADEAVEVARLFEEVQGASSIVWYQKDDLNKMKKSDTSFPMLEHVPDGHWKHSAEKRDDGWTVKVRFEGPLVSIMEPPVYELDLDRQQIFRDLRRLETTFGPK